MVLSGCGTTPPGTPLPAWAQALRADGIVLVADLQGHASSVQLQTDVDKITADLAALGPAAQEIKAAADVLIADFRDNATVEKKIADAITLLTTVNKLRE
jgi:hypothetical protein